MALPDSTRRFYLWVALVVGLTVLTRWPLVMHPRAIDDEQVYVVVAREMLQGGLPYIAAVERKPPLLFALYALVLAGAGRANWPALHLTALLWTLATMATLFAIAGRLFDAWTGLIAAAGYGLYQMWGDARSLSLNGELLMNLPIALAFFITLASEQRRWRPELLAAGALIAVATLLKQPAGIGGLPLAIYVLSPGYRRSRDLDWGDSLWHAVELALGFTATFGVAAVILSRYGILGDAWYWSVLAHRSPIGPTNWYYWAMALPNSGLFLLETVPLWLGTIAAFRATSVWRQRRPERTAMLALLVVSLLGVGVNGQFLRHYYLQLLPALCLLAAPALRSAWNGTGRPTLLAVAVLGLGLFTVVDTAGLLRDTTDSPAGSWVRTHSRADDRLFVWGQADRITGMYLDADRRPASRYIASYPLTGHVFGGYPSSWGLEYETGRILPGAWDTLFADFGRHPPRFIIDAEAVRPHPRYPLSRYPTLARYITEHYQIAAPTADGIVFRRAAQ